MFIPWISLRGWVCFICLVTSWNPWALALGAGDVYCYVMLVNADKGPTHPNGPSPTQALMAMGDPVFQPQARLSRHRWRRAAGQVTGPMLEGLCL